MHHILLNSYYFYKYIFIGALPRTVLPDKTGKIVAFWSDRHAGMLRIPVSSVMSRRMERTAGVPWIFWDPLIISVKKNPA
jgi:hypothetical protein